MRFPPPSVANQSHRHADIIQCDLEITFRAALDRVRLPPSLEGRVLSEVSIELQVQPVTSLAISLPKHSLAARGVVPLLGPDQRMPCQCATTRPSSVWQGVLRSPAGAPSPAPKFRLKSTVAQAQALTSADGISSSVPCPSAPTISPLKPTAAPSDYAQTIDLTATPSPVALALSSGGQLTVILLAVQNRNRRRTAFEPGRQRVAAQWARFQHALIARRRHHDGRQRRHQLHPAVCHQRPARR